MSAQAYSPEQVRALTRKISLVENAMPGHEDLLRALEVRDNARVIGVTGPPGAGKSTLVDALIQRYVGDDKRVAVVCVDPSSPFSHGALLGDRIRMNRWHDHPGVFIRSLSSRGALGGLNPMTIGVTELLCAEGFDRVIVETVGVGQSEVEIAGLADITVVVLVPEGGDEIQAMKAGLLEIADIFVVNKGDRPDADAYMGSLRSRIPSNSDKEIPLFKCIASTGEGVDAIHQAIEKGLGDAVTSDRKVRLLADKAWQLIRERRMRDVDRKKMEAEIREEMNKGGMRLFRFIDRY